MVRIYEYNGKKLLGEIGITVPEGDVASTPSEAKEIAKKIGKPVAVKAQVWATGRFKAGGIKFAHNPDEAEKIAKEILGTRIKGLRVEQVLVEEKLGIDKEFYVGVIVDDSTKVRGPIVIFSTEGGVDIEQTSEEFPEKVVSQTVDYIQGFSINDARELVTKLVVSTDLVEPLSKAVLGVYELFKKSDARVAEVNPLVLSKEGEIYAADCRITMDDNAAPRHPEFRITLPRDMDRPAYELEKIAWTIEANDFRGVAYFAQLVPEIKEEGYIGFHGMGGGGAMLAADALIRRGLRPANYSDSSGNPTAAKVYRLAKVILSQCGIEGLLVADPNYSSQEMWHSAHGLVKAIREDLADKPGFPVVVLWAGNKEEESHQIMREMLKDLPIQLELYGREHVYDVDFVADRMIKLVGEYRRIRRGK